MFQKLKMESFKKVALTCLVLLALGIGLLVLSDFAIIDYLKGPTPIEDVALEDLPGTYVEMEVDFIYDYYAQTVITKNGLETGEIDSQEYIIPIGEQEFMGLYVGKSDISDADDIMQVTQDILSELADEPEYSMTVRGTVVEMDAQRLSFYHQSAGIDELDDSVKELFLPYVLQSGFVGPNELAMMWFYTGASALSLGLFLFMIVRVMTGNYQKSIRRFCKASGDEESVKEKVSNFFESNEPMYGIRANSSYVMFSNGPASHVVSASDVVWVYQKTTSHRVNLIPTYKSYALAICMRDGKTYEATCGSKNKTEAALQYLMAALPKAVVGYSAELESLYNSDRARFCGLKEEIANAKAEPLEAETVPARELTHEDSNEI